MKNNPIEKIRDLLAEPEARRKAAICAGLAAALAVGGAGIAIASNRPEPIDSTPSAVEKTGADDKEASGAESVAPADRVQGQSLRTIVAISLSTLLGSLVSGYLLDLGGTTLMLWFSAGCAAVGTAVGLAALALQKKHAQEERHV